MVTELRRQEALAALRILDTSPEDRFDRITRLAQRMFDVPMVSITLIDADRQWRKSHVGLTTEAPREDAFCELVTVQDAALFIRDAAADERFRENPFVVGDPHLRFYAGEPLHAPDGAAVGTLCVLDTVPHELSDEDAALLRDLADWVQAELDRDEESDGVAVVQTTLLPRRKPTAAGFDLAAAVEPGAKIAGDFYDWYDSGDGFCVTVGDVIGRGMPSAIIAATVRAALRSATPFAGLEGAVREVSRSLAEDLGPLSALATVLHARVAADGLVEYIDAGHDLAFVVRSGGGATRLEETDLPLGRVASAVTVRSVRLEPGDALVCLSDGALDALGGEHGIQRAESIVRGSATAAGAVSRIVSASRAASPLNEALAIVVRRERR
jgi:hypothetical protein